MPLFALAFSCVLYLIVDLDRAHEGLLQTSQLASYDRLTQLDANNAVNATLEM